MPLIPPSPNGASPNGGERAPQVARATRDGRILATDQFPRVGVVGPPGMQAEVSLTKDGYHGVITLLGGHNMAGVGFPPDMLRELAKHCEEAARQIERRHGR